MKRLLLVLGIVAIIAQPARANEVSSKAVNYPGSPVNVTYCLVGPQDDAPQWVLQLDFTDVSEVTLNAVEIRFSIYDAFGKLLHNEDIAYSGTFSPGVSIQRSGRGIAGGWTIGDFHMPPRADFSSATCSIIETKDANGTVWTAPDTPKAGT